MNHLWLRTLLLNTPLYLHGHYLDELLSVLSERLNITHINTNTGRSTYQSQQSLTSDIDRVTCIDGQIVGAQEETKPAAAFAVVPVLGSLVQRGGALQSDSTVLQGYDRIERGVREAAAEGLGGVMLRVDSPGGVHHGCCETSQAIRKLSADYNIPVWASVEGSAFSAAYNLASSAERINAQPSSYAGSIGALIVHTSVSEALDRSGIEVTIIRSGAKKAAGHPAEKLSAQTVAEVQQKVDAARDQFVDTVDAHRDAMTRRGILSQEAGWFTAKDSLQEGLIDSVGPSNDFYQEFFEHINNSSTAVSLAGAGTTTETEMSGKATKEVDAPDLEAQVKQVQAEAEQFKTDTSARYKAIYSHANACVDPAFTAELADDPGVSIDRATGMLDRIAKPQAAAPQEPEPVTDDQLTQRFGASALDGIDAQEKSFLQKVYRKSAGPTVPLDNFDPLNPNEPQNAPAKTKAEDEMTPFEKMEARLDKEYGATENGGKTDAA